MQIIVCPLARVSELARAHRPSHVVSLLDPGTRFPQLALPEQRHLCIGVHDIEVEEPGFDALCPDRMQTLLAFISRWPRRDTLLIHCFAGISRSTATAFIAACMHNPEIDEAEIAQALRRASPSANPNRRFVALADAELGRGGRMVRAVDGIGAGATWLEIGEADPFRLPGTFAQAG